MDDFIFGSLNTEEKRTEVAKAQRGGITHAQHRTPRDPKPGEAVAIELTVGPTHLHEQAWVYWTNDGSDPAGANGEATHGFATPLKLAAVEWDTLLWGYVRRFRGEIPGQADGTVVRYRVAAGDALADDGAYYGYFVDDAAPPEWAKDAILYQIFADRFYSSSPDFPRVEQKPSLMCNGTLRGIIEQLDYLAGLGVNCLWLTPIFPSPTYHGYHATDFFDIEPRLGTKADFKELLDKAHARGLRVLLDFVPNHWSHEHPTFVEASEFSNSPYIPWYTFERWPDLYKTFFGVRELPQINLRHGAARAHVLEAAQYWLDFGVDGYRVDYCIGPSPDFYADFRRVTRAANPQAWTFGEAIHPPDSQIVFEGGMDGTLDFILLEAFREAFAYGRWDAPRFADFLERHEGFFPESFSRPSFLDNHDMNRFLWLAQGDARKLKLAALCQFTLGGAPIIYYGTEVGLSQERDMRQGGWAIHEEARLPMLWGQQQDHELLDFYQKLCALRQREAALRRGARQTVLAEGHTLAYRRASAEGSVVVVLNLTEQAAEVTLNMAEHTAIFTTDSKCQAQAKDGHVHLTLPSWGGMVLK